jgi:hypothetical protein
MKQAIWVKCNGEAHTNPHIDHCPVCAPHWGEYPTCPYCGSTRLGNRAIRAKCRKCGKMVGMERDRSPKGALKLDLSHINTKLKLSDMPELQRVIDDLEMTINRTRNAMGAMDKVTEFENLRKAYDALKRAELVLTPIMFKFVGE